ncbi:heavy-metal-associated domain-containing protein [Agromyces sp. NPDC058484]|uniref:heavy-metal-associated domain-containing protein n=1 Tax=Agromyces sp. NPDC058484 TaxID=3346524 RepID=UPI0036460875
MRTATRLGLFAVATAAVFAVAFGAARAFIPAEVSAAPTSDSAEDAMHAHDTAETDGDQAATAAGDDVRGLSISHAGYRLSELRAPDGTGASGDLSFTLLGPGAEPLTGYDRAHEKDLHLIVVRTDGAEFRHVHPTTDGAGAWTIPWSWAAAGTYRVFADFVPTALGDTVTLTSTLEVAGDFAPAPRGADTATSTDGEVTVELDGELVAGASSELTFAVTRDGEPVTTLEPYLGAYGHLVALRDGDLAYLHVHPMGEPADGETEPGPEITFMAQAPTPGRYLLYLDLQLDGRVHSLPFVVTADEADAAASRQSDTDDGRDAHGDEH